MVDDEGVMRLSKRLPDKGGEVDYKTKAGTAWSHSYLNQKPWHPLSYPNQRRKWIAEQLDAQRQRRSEEVAREFAQEQEFFRQAASISKKEKEKVEMMQAVSFMYVRPPGYNAESAKAAELEDERKQLIQKDAHQETADAPLMQLETGVPMRVKPFAVEVRNVRCVRCGTYGHQSGDRDCPLKDVIMPNEESRLKRDDPLTVIMAHADARFLDGGGPDLFTGFLGKEKHSKKKDRSKKSLTSVGDSKDHNRDSVVDMRSEKKKKKKQRLHFGSSSYSTSDSDQEQRKRKPHRPHSGAYSSSDSDKNQEWRRSSNVDVRSKRHKHKKIQREDSDSSRYSDLDSGYNPRKGKHHHPHSSGHRRKRKHRNAHSESSSSPKSNHQRRKRCR
ncbi:unnamed protein product [Victoria cruziana]